MCNLYEESDKLRRLENDQHVANNMIFCEIHEYYRRNSKFGHVLSPAKH